VVTVEWRLGSTPGNQHFTATLAAGGASVLAGATAAPVPEATPPVVVEVNPANAEKIDDAWRERSAISLRFDQAMDPAGLASPDPWLRAWIFPENADGLITKGVRVRLEPVDVADGTVATYRLEGIDNLRFAVVVMALGSSPEIVSAGPDLALDADYRGTELEQDELDALWTSDDFVADARFRNRLKDSGNRLPSGDGTPGGKYFTSFFTAALGQ
jgi:hypothetical protein